MKHRKHSYAIIFGCVMVICGFFLPWFSYRFWGIPVISGFQMWLGGLPDAMKYTPHIVPELFSLLWLLPLAALLTCALNVLEIFNKMWDRQWIQLVAYGALWFVMGLFIWPSMTARETNWGLWLCLAGWLFTFASICAGVSFEKKQDVASTAALSPQQRTRRNLARGLVGLVGLSSLGLGGFLWTSWTHHQRAIFTRQYLNPPDYQVRGLLNMIESWILRVSWSPNGKRLLVGQLHIAPQSWDALTGENIYTYQPADATVGIWSPDGQHIAFSDPIPGRLFASGALLVIINATTGTQEAELTQQTSQIEIGIAGSAWSPDCQYLAVGGLLDPIVKLWNPFTGEMGRTYTIHSQEDAGISGIRDLAWSPNGQYLAAAISDASLLPDGTIDKEARLTPADLLGIYIWHVQSGDLLLHYSAEISFDSYRGSLLSWSPDGKRLAFANKTTIQLLDLALQKPVLTYAGHVFEPSSVAWSPDGKYIASSGSDWTVQVWDASTGALRFLYQGHSSSVGDAAWSPDGKYIASGGFDGTVQVWQPAL